MRNDRSITVNLASTKKEHEEVLQFVMKTYKKVFGTKPSLPQIIFVARRSGEVVGTIGFNFYKSSKDLLNEGVFIFNRNETPFLVSKSRTIQYVRWISARPSVSMALIYKATLYAVRQGIEYGWCEQKERAAMASRRMGVILHHVKGATINYDNVHKRDLSYYSNEPLPMLYMLHLPQILEVLKSESVQQRNKLSATYT